MHKNKIEIGGEIKGGFCIYHGVRDVLYLNKAGKNLSIYQNVTLGRNPKTEKNGICVPTIENNVSIYTNAVVIGNIKIENNVKIGAGAVVTKDVADNCTGVGNPMRVISRL